MSMAKTKAKLFRQAMERARKKVDLAEIYLDDGAIATAAKNFREAADELDKAKEARDAALHAGWTP